MLSQYHQDSWISSFPTKHQQVVTCFYHFLSTSRNFHNVSFSRPFLCRWLIFNSGGHFLVTLSALLGKVLWILLLGQQHFCLISAEKSKSFWIICKCLKSDTCQVLHQKPNRILDETAGSYINMRKLRQMPPAIALLQYLPPVCYTDRRPWCGFELLTSMIHSSPTHRWNAKLSLDEFDQKEIEEGWWRLPKQHVHSSLSSWNLQAPKLSVRIAMAKQAVVATQPLSVLQLTHVGFCSQPLSDVMLQPETGNKPGTRPSSHLTEAGSQCPMPRLHIAGLHRSWWDICRIALVIINGLGQPQTSGYDANSICHRWESWESYASCLIKQLHVTVGLQFLEDLGAVLTSSLQPTLLKTNNKSSSTNDDDPPFTTIQHFTTIHSYKNSLQEPTSVPFLPGPAAEHLVVRITICCWGYRWCGVPIWHG